MILLSLCMSIFLTLSPLSKLAGFWFDLLFIVVIICTCFVLNSYWCTIFTNDFSTVLAKRMNVFSPYWAQNFFESLFHSSVLHNLLESAIYCVTSYKH